MSKIILASNNPKKLKELQQLLDPLTYSVISQKELGIESVAETGLTFVENALLKARHAAAVSGLPALADDSGLSVDSLQGAPGLYSARYAGEFATDEQNNTKLIAALGELAPPYTARYHCAIVYLQYPNDPIPLIVEGTWEGEMVLSPQGHHGFGYDPLFYVPSEQCTAAELTARQKEQLSHRGQAIRKLITAIKNKESIHG